MEINPKIFSLGLSSKNAMEIYTDVYRAVKMQAKAAEFINKLSLSPDFAEKIRGLSGIISEAEAIRTRCQPRYFGWQAYFESVLLKKIFSLITAMNSGVLHEMEKWLSEYAIWKSLGCLDADGIVSSKKIRDAAERVSLRINELFELTSSPPIPRSKAFFEVIENTFTNTTMHSSNGFLKMSASRRRELCSIASDGRVSPYVIAVRLRVLCGAALQSAIILEATAAKKQDYMLSADELTREYLELFSKAPHRQDRINWEKIDGLAQFCTMLMVEYTKERSIKQALQNIVESIGKDTAVLPF